MGGDQGIREPGAAGRFRLLLSLVCHGRVTGERSMLAHGPVRQDDPGLTAEAAQPVGRGTQPPGAEVHGDNGPGHRTSLSPRLVRSERAGIAG